MESYKYLSDKEVQLFKKIQSEKNYYEDSTKSIRKDIYEEVWKLYTQYVDEKEQTMRSRKRLPKVKRAVNTLAAFLVNNNPTFNALPIGEGDELKAELIKELIQYQAKRRDMLNLKYNSKVMVKSATLFGNGYLKVYWKTLTDSEGNVIFNGPVAEPVHPMDFFADPYIGLMQNQRSVIQRFVLPVVDVQNNPSYKLPKDYKPSYNDSQTTHYDSSRLDHYDLTVSQGDIQAQGKVELWEYWTKDMVYTIADPEGQPIFIRSMKNPNVDPKTKYVWLPYVKMDYEIEPVPNRFLASGAIGPNIKVNKAIDEVVNNIIDNIRIIINPMYKIRRGANIDPRQLVSRPGGFIETENVQQDVEQLRTSDTTGTGFNLLNLMQSEFREGTAVDTYRQGLQGSANTAAEANIQQENADVVTSSVKENFEDAIAEVGQMVAKLNVINIQGSMTLRIFNPELLENLSKGITEQELSQEELQEIQNTGTLYGNMLSDEDVRSAIQTGTLPGMGISEDEKEKIKQYGKIVKYGPEWFDVDVDIEVVADSTINKNTAVLRKQLMDFLQLAGQLGVQVDMLEAGKRFSDLSGIPNVHKLIKQPEPMPMLPTGQMPQGQGGMPPLPQRGQEISQRGINQSIQQGAQQL